MKSVTAQMICLVTLLSPSLVPGAITSLVPHAMAQGYAPAIDYTSLLNMKFFENGNVRLDDANLVFAPPGGVEAQVEILKADGTSVAKQEYFPEYAFAAKAFGRLRIKGPSDVQLSQSGNYLLQFHVAGKPSTRFPFSMKALPNKDPFDTAQKFQFAGPWRSLAYIWERPFKNTTIPDIVFWVGGADLPAGKTRDMTVAKLYQNGKLVGYSKKVQGNIAAGGYLESTHTFFAPHDARQAHAAPPISRSQFMVNGNHVIRIERQSDGALLRTFPFTVQSGQIKQLPRTVLGYSPIQNFIPPRVPVKGSSTYEFKPAVWLETK